MAATQFAYLPLPPRPLFLFFQSDFHSSLECSLVSLLRYPSLCLAGALITCCQSPYQMGIKSPNPSPSRPKIVSLDCDGQQQFPAKMLPFTMLGGGC